MTAQEEAAIHALITAVKVIGWDIAVCRSGDDDTVLGVVVGQEGFVQRLTDTGDDFRYLFVPANT